MDGVVCKESGVVDDGRGGAARKTRREVEWKRIMKSL
jgi:hypothetical protein